MPNTYRVDRNDSQVTTPCGMNSLLYIGDSWKKARTIFNQAEPHKDAWNRPNATYGVTLAVWSENKRDYVVKAIKGF